MTCDPWTPDTEVNIQIKWKMYCPDHRKEVSNQLEEVVAEAVQRFMKMYDLEEQSEPCSELSMTMNVFGPSYGVRIAEKLRPRVYHYHARRFK